MTDTAGEFDVGLFDHARFYSGEVFKSSGVADQMQSAVKTILDFMGTWVTPYTRSATIDIYGDATVTWTEKTTIQAAISPTPQSELAKLPEGHRTDGMLNIYFDKDQENVLEVGDKIKWLNQDYEIIEFSTWAAQQQDIYFKARAAKLD